MEEEEERRPFTHSSNPGFFTVAPISRPRPRLGANLAQMEGRSSMPRGSNEDKNGKILEGTRNFWVGRCVPSMKWANYNSGIRGCIMRRDPWKDKVVP